MWYVCARHGNAGRISCFLSVLFLFLAEYSAVASQESPQSFTFQGQLLNSSGTAAATGTIGLTLDIYDPSGLCLLYEESQTGINLTESQGLFSVAVGSATGASKRTTNDPGLSMAQVFANSGAQTRASASANCTAGYTPVPGDARTLRVTLVPQSGSPITLSPDQIIDSAPQANVAETLQGTGPTGFVQISGNTGAYTAAKAGLDALLGTGTSGVVDASAYHTHDGRYVQIGTTPQNVGSGGWYTSGVGGTGVSAAPTGTQFEVMSSGTTTVGEIIKAGSSQTGDLLDIESNSGTVLSSFSSTGALTTPGIQTGSGGLQLAASTYLGLGNFPTPPASCSTAGQIWYSGGSVQYCNDSNTVETLGTSGAGLQSLNGQTGNTQTFGTPTSAGTGFGWTSASNVHTLNIPMAATGTVTAGLLSNADYTTFSGKVGGGASLSHTGTLPQVSGSGTITEATGFAVGQTAGVTNLTVTAGASQSTNDLADWKATGGSSTLYSLNSSGTPSATTDLATKSFVSGAVSTATSGYLPLGGGTMTGPLVVPANGLTAGTNQLVLSGGNVGIGTTSPIAQFSVALPSGTGLSGGSGTYGGFFYTPGQAGVLIGHSNSKGLIQSASDDLSSSKPLQINPQGGSVCIGASCALNTLDVVGQMAIGSYAGNNTAPTNGLIVSGSVGIGTTSPAAALDVNGGIDIAGTNGISYPSSDSTAGGSIAIGVSALASQSTSAAYRNTVIGYQALSASGMTTGSTQNTAIGYQALQNDASGTQNTVIGYQAGQAHNAANGTNGSGNTIIGVQAFRNGAGGSNVAIGAGAMGNAGSNASYNNVVGTGSGGSITGGRNEVLGTGAAGNLGSGGSNVIIGDSVANSTLTTGSNNILIGTSSSVDTPASNTSNFIDIGNVIFATGATGTLSSPAGNVGIGTTSPGAGLDVAVAGAASTPGVQVNGAWFTTGTGSTNTPQLLVEPSGTSSSTWSTQGTGLGVNAASGFSGNLIDLQVNGSSVFSVSSNGTITGTLSNASVDWAAPGTIGGTTPAAAAFTTVTDTGYTQSTGNFAMSGTGNFTTGTGTVSLNGATTVAANQNLTMASGTGQFAQTYTGTSNAAAITANSLGSGTAALTIGSSSTSGTVYGIKSSLTGAATTNVAGYFSATGATNNYGLLVPSGNVGIGTTSPDAPFVVIGATATDYGTGEPVTGVFKGSSAGTVHLVVDNTNGSSFSNEIDFESNGAQKWTVYNDSPSNGTQDFSIYDSVANKTRLFINPAGNVGIGTTNPGAALDLGSASVTAGFLPPSAAGAAPITVGMEAFDTTAKQPVFGDGSVTHHIDPTRTISFQFGTPGGSAINTGVLGYMTIPFACTITGWSIQVDTGTATIKTLKVATGTAIPTLASNSISTSGISISSGTVEQSTTVSDFTTTAVSKNDIVAADLTAVSGAGYINFQLACVE